MGRLPVQGGDDGTWGTVLNDFLTQAHSSDGSLKPGSITAAGGLDQAAADARYVEGSGVGQPNGVASLDGSGKVPAAQLPAPGSAPDATTSTKGVVQLAGDLGGTAAIPTVPGLSTKVSSSIATAKGDLLAASAANTLARLPAGANGQVLTADSTETTGLKWVPAANGNSTVTNVRDHGATGDGTTDDTAAIQAAIDATPEGGTVYFYPGIYIVSSTIRLKQYRTYLGNGGMTGVTVFNATTGLTDAVMASEAWYSNFTTCDNPIRIEGLMVDGDNIGANVRGIVMLNFWSRIVDVQIARTTGNGIELNDTTRNGTNTITNSASENTITACRFDGIGGCGIYQRSGNQQANLDGRVESCFFNNCAQYGIRLGRAAGWYVQNNHLYGMGWDAISMDSCYATTVAYNYVEDFGGQNAANPGDPTYGYYNGISMNTILNSGRASIIIGNTVTNVQPSSPNAQRFNCLYANAGSGQTSARVVIEGNNFGWASTSAPAVSKSWATELTANSGGYLEVTYGSGQIQRNANWQRTLVYDSTKVNLIEPGGGTSPRPLVGWTVDPNAVSGANSLTLAPGTVYVVEADLKAGLASTIDFNLSAGGSGLTAGYVGLYDINRAQLGVSNNSTGAFTASGTKSISLASAVPVADGRYYIAILVVGSTGPAIQASASLGIANLGRTAAPYRSATADTGQSSLPATLTGTQSAIGQTPLLTAR